MTTLIRRFDEGNDRRRICLRKLHRFAIRSGFETIANHIVGHKTEIKKLRSEICNLKNASIGNQAWHDTDINEVWFDMKNLLLQDRCK